MNEPEEKEVPSVGKPNHSHPIKNRWIQLMVVVFLGLIVWTNYSSKGEEVEKVQEEFKPSNNRNVTGRTNKPVHKTPEVVEQEQQQNEKPEMTKEQYMAIMEFRANQEKKAKAAKDAEQKKLEEIEFKKRNSPMRIISNSVSNPTRTTGGPQATSFQANSQQTQGANDSPYALGSPKAIDVTHALRLPAQSQTLTKGKFLAGVLETKVDSTLPGPVRAVVSNDVYSEDGSKILIEKGSRLIGEYRSGIQRGQNRVYVIWSHVLTTRGLQIAIESTGTDQLGTTGMTGDYDTHFFKRFSAAFVLSIIENQDNGNNSNLNISSQSALNQASGIALNESINIPPTIYVDQGEKINVFVARNILFEGI